MLKIYNKAKVEIKEIRKFLKDYNTDNLIIVLTKDWRRIMFSHEKNKLIKENISSKILGQYFGIRNGSGFAFGVGGVKNIHYPYIVINCNNNTYLKTFYHEFAHYLQDMRIPIVKYQRVEKEAREFSCSMMQGREDD